MARLYFTRMSEQLKGSSVGWRIAGWIFILGLFLYQAVKYFIAYAKSSSTADMIGGIAFALALAAWIVDARRGLRGATEKTPQDSDQSASK